MTAPVQYRVLLVEDNAVNQKLAPHLLTKLECAVEVAADGLAGVRISLEAAYDLIYMDCQMPEMDGYTATGTLRGAGVVTPIEALTANAMAHDREQCLAAGMNDYISKPLHTSELARTLHLWTGRR